jgi:hypothetical protein
VSEGTFITVSDPEAKESGSQAAEGTKGKAARNSSSSEDQK